jgi:hypothetical protein
VHASHHRAEDARASCLGVHASHDPRRRQFGSKSLTLEMLGHAKTSGQASTDAGEQNMACATTDAAMPTRGPALYLASM